MSLVTYSRRSLPQAKDRLPPFDLGSACSHGTCCDSVGGLLVPPLTSCKDQSVERESCPTAESLPDEEGGPCLISPSTGQHCSLAEGNEDAPPKSPGFTLSSLVLKKIFHGYPEGIRLSTLSLTTLPLLIQNPAELYGKL